MINHIYDNIYIGDWQEAKYAFERGERVHGEKFDEIFTCAKDSPFIGNHFYGLVDGPYSENERLLASAIDDLLEIRNEDWQLNKMILVHCVSGFSRSVAVVAGYMVKKGCVHTVEEALYHIKKIRPLANPVPELIRLLKKYEQT